VNETIDIRPGEELDVTALEPYLRERLPSARGPLEIRQFGGGHANLVYLLTFGDAEFVLRRPPHGPLPKGGHDMDREYNVLSRLYAYYPLAPRAYLLCTDHAVLGADFVIEERRSGTIIRGPIPSEVASDPAKCRALGTNFIDTLADLHNVDYTAAGLADLGKPEGYLQRQFDGWRKRWDAADTPDRIDAAAYLEKLGRTLPQSGPPGIVHNDFKFDNTILDNEDLTRPIAVLDWDMCTIGDPLADLGNVLTLWMEPGDPPPIGSSIMQTVHPGFPTRAELIERYARRTGRDCSNIAWYTAFNFFRYAVIAQQIYARFVRGQTQDRRFAGFGYWVSALVSRGIALADSEL
jgi:aminoglycoside phosphotransferase (APT) family kinase protein